MKISLRMDYVSFRLRDDTEQINYSGGAHLFVEDFKIPYTIVEMDEVYGDKKVDRIEFKEYHNNVQVEIDRIEDLLKMIQKYQFTLILDEDKNHSYTIRFK